MHAIFTLVRTLLAAVLGLLVLLAGVSMIGVGDALKNWLVARVGTVEFNLPDWVPPDWIPKDWLSSFSGSFTEAVPLVILTAFLAAGKFAASGLQAGIQAPLRKALESSAEFIQGDEGAGSRFFRASFRAWIALALVFGSTGWLGVIKGPPETETREPAVVIGRENLGTLGGSQKAKEEPVMVFATVRVKGEEKYASLCGYVGATEADVLNGNPANLRAVASVHYGDSSQPGGHLSMIVPKGQWWGVKDCGELEEKAEATEVYWHSIGFDPDLSVKKDE